MQITHAEVIPIELNLRTPLHTAYTADAPITRIGAVFVRIETRQGDVAWGCTAIGTLPDRRNSPRRHPNLPRLRRPRPRPQPAQHRTRPVRISAANSKQPRQPCAPSTLPSTTCWAWPPGSRSTACWAATATASRRRSRSAWEPCRRPSRWRATARSRASASSRSRAASTPKRTSAASTPSTPRCPTSRCAWTPTTATPSRRPSTSRMRCTAAWRCWNNPFRHPPASRHCAKSPHKAPSRSWPTRASSTGVGARNRRAARSRRPQHQAGALRRHQLRPPDGRHRPGRPHRHDDRLRLRTRPPHRGRTRLRPEQPRRPLRRPRRTLRPRGRPHHSPALSSARRLAHRHRRARTGVYSEL